ncbi:putative LIM-domain binding protein/SEUSS [Lupinus albus]|uniref:Putative LIM-domain binding protein/SEUSS n=1 Tax=Lupinus albus TaxID=3870 RepID=A0A6A4R8E1_LUPAL|nr:putative LIM-domain binding protein/SEUSS [Lupinus albus]
MTSISQLGAAAQKFQSCTQGETSNSSVSELQNNCNMFLASAHGLAKALEAPLVNELGYTKRYVRCLQIAEVVNSMKDLIDYSTNSGTGPMESLANFTRRTSSSCALRIHEQQSEDQPQKRSRLESQPQQQQPSNGDQNSSQNASSKGFTSANNTLNSASASTTTSTIVGLHQNSMNSRHQGSMNNVTPFSSNNPPQSSANPRSRAQSPADISLQQQQPLLSGEADANELMSYQMTVTGGMATAGSLGNDNLNGNSGVTVGGYGRKGTGPSGTADGNRPEIGNNSVMDGSLGMVSIAMDQAMNNLQEDLSSQLVTGLGSVNDFNNLQFD